MSPKKSLKMTLAEENKLRKKVGLPPRNRITGATIRAGWKKKAKALSQEQRQHILDLIWTGLAFGEIAARAQVDTDTVLGVDELNAFHVRYLRKESL